MLRYATVEPSFVGEVGLIKIRSHSLARCRNIFSNEKITLGKFYINSKNERFAAIKPSYIFINNNF